MITNQTKMRTARRQRVWDKTNGICFYCQCDLAHDKMMGNYIDDSHTQKRRRNVPKNELRND